MKPQISQSCDPGDDKVVYHYCDANALLSILQNKNLRYTHAAYLNDAVEIELGVSICNDILDGMLQKKSDDRLLIRIKEFLGNAENWRYYICCFSKSKDKLSQWRAYADDGAGFAIGFRGHELNPNSDDCFECRCAPIAYEDASLRSDFEARLTDFRQQIGELPPETSEPDLQFVYENAGARIGGQMIDQAVFHKGAGFIEEEEWRSIRSYKLEDTQTERELCLKPPTSLLFKVFQELAEKHIERRKFRNGRFGITPYIEVGFQPHAVLEIVCGPRTPEKLTEASLIAVRKSVGMDFVISRSLATYR